MIFKKPVKLISEKIIKTDYSYILFGLLAISLRKATSYTFLEYKTDFFEMIITHSLTNTILELISYILQNAC